MGSYEVVDLAEWTRGESEPGGDEAKRWFIAPDCSRFAGHWLFKPRRIKALTLSKARQKLGAGRERRNSNNRASTSADI